MSTLEDKAQFAILKKAGLIYVSDQEPGISRERRGKNFCYRLPSGDLLTDPEVRTRIKSLGLPPAYDNVWICLKENGHLQATGLDARGRKQYRYHNDWHMLRDEKKFDELPAFGQALPAIRRRAARDLERHAEPQRVTLAALVLLLDTSYLRVGNKTYRDTNGTYGATTLLKRHVRFGDDLELRFAAKGGRKIRRRLKAPKLQKVLERIADCPVANCSSGRTTQVCCIPSMPDISIAISASSAKGAFRPRRFAPGAERWLLFPKPWKASKGEKCRP